jgi:ubiquinone/menaquinone biosynthesis C-methylase UbiE
MQPKRSKKPNREEKTSWGKVAHWYGEHLAEEDTYHAKVVMPNLLRVLNLTEGEAVLDLACGEGYFSRAMAKEGAKVTGADISKELIGKAIQQGSGAFHVAPANKLAFAMDASFDKVVCVLALQNIEDLTGTLKEVRRVLKPRGAFVMVLNHPAFRVLKRSSWGWDEENKVQYRRIDGYLSGAKVSIDMAPGSRTKAHTISYHRSLQDFFKAFTAAGFAVAKLEEWISHRESGKGPRQKAEDAARKEIPLFLMLEAGTRSV